MLLSATYRQLIKNARRKLILSTRYRILVLLYKRKYFHIKNKARWVNNVQKKSKYSAGCKEAYYNQNTTESEMNYERYWHNILINQEPLPYEGGHLNFYAWFMKNMKIISTEKR
jgi:hypothetical protein